jgi:phosphoribosyl 1,2-cyclic phosphodiesterase
MIIRYWGARGSIPVFGQEYLKYGGSTTCVEVRTKDDRIIIIDAGSGMRRLGNALVHENRREVSLVFTHAHWDHLMGFPFFKPLYMAGVHIEAFGCPFAQDSIRDMLSATMRRPNFPVDLTEVKAQVTYHGYCDRTFTIGPVTITPILLSHPNQGIGYKFVEDGKSFVFLTDNELTFVHPGGLTFQDYVQFSAGADLLVHDAEFTAAEYERTKMWGHSVYGDALRLGMEAGVATLGLFHHNQDRADEAVDAIVGDCRRLLAKANVGMQCMAVAEGMEMVLS